MPAALLVSLTGALIAIRYRRGSSRPIRSLVVLPFANLSANPQTEYLADGQILYIRFDPTFDSLHSDARFVTLETKLGLL